MPSGIDSYEVAYLRGGNNDVTRAIVMARAERGWLKAEQDGQKIGCLKRRPSEGEFSALAQTVYDGCSESRDAAATFASDLPNRVVTFCRRYEGKLQLQQLLRGDALNGMAWKVALLGAALL
jgi:hypothetical protein